MFIRFSCSRFETLQGEPLKPRSILRLSSSPFLVLYIDDQNISFQADFGPTSNDIGDNKLEQLSSPPPTQHRSKRFVEITADNAEVQDNDINGWDMTLTKNGRPQQGSPTVSVTTAKIRRRRKNKPAGKKYKPFPERNWENEVLSFDDTDVNLVDDDENDGGDDEDDNDEADLQLDYEEDDLSEPEADQFRWSPAGKNAASSSGDDADLIPLPRGYRNRHKSGGVGEGSKNGGGGGGRRRDKVRKNRRGNNKAEIAASKGKPRGPQLPSLWKSFENQVKHFKNLCSSFQVVNYLF
jgi:hypothetical protein